MDLSRALLSTVFVSSPILTLYLPQIITGHFISGDLGPTLPRTDMKSCQVTPITDDSIDRSVNREYQYCQLAAEV